jgi:hypothetical protein
MLVDLVNREIELLIARATSLTCGVVGHYDNEAGNRVARIGGSGVFIAPCQAITASHVARDLFRTDPNRADDLLKRREPGYFGVPHSCALFQVSSSNPTSAATWAVTRSWEHATTDLCLLEAAPDNPAGHDMLNRTRGMFTEWSLLPPPVGTRIEMFGLPSTELTISDTDWNLRFPFVLQQAVVSEVCDIRHDRGLYYFPGFLVDQAVDHGFSGGPVFWGGRLCGLVSGGLFGSTYIASLWPLCLMEIEYPNLGTLNRKAAIGDWFDEGRLVSPDWPAIKPRISRRLDEFEQPFVHIDAG